MMSEPQLSMFSEEPQTHEPPGFELGWLSVAGHKKVNQPGFDFFSARVADGGFVLVGCVSSGVWKSGKRKGRPRYDGQQRTVIVTRQEVDRERTEYEMATGFCGECRGAGQVVWSVGVDGKTWTTCVKCSGTGRASTDA